MDRSALRGRIANNVPTWRVLHIFCVWWLLIEPVIQEMDLRMAAEGAANRSPDPRFNQPHTEDRQCDVKTNRIGK